MKLVYIAHTSLHFPDAPSTFFHFPLETRIDSVIHSFCKREFQLKLTAPQIKAMTYCYAVHLELPITSREILPPSPFPLPSSLSAQSEFDSKNETETVPRAAVKV